MPPASGEYSPLTSARVDLKQEIMSTSWSGLEPAVDLACGRILSQSSPGRQTKNFFLTQASENPLYFT